MINKRNQLSRSDGVGKMEMISSEGRFSVLHLGGGGILYDDETRVWLPGQFTKVKFNHEKL